MSDDDTTNADRDVSSVSTDGHAVSFLSPADQTIEDRRQAERAGLNRRKPLSSFFRMFGIRTRDVP